MFGSKLQRISPEEGRRVQRPKRREYGTNDEDNSPNDVNSYNSSSLKYRQMVKLFNSNLHYLDYLTYVKFKIHPPYDYY